MQRHLHFKLVLSFAVFFLPFVTEVRAEITSRVPGDFGWRKSIPLQFILEKAVIADLGLAEDAAERLKLLHAKIQTEVETERLAAKNDGPKNKWVRGGYPWNDPILHIVRNRHGDELNELLTPEQQERLHQIHIQRQENQIDALSDSGVAKELKLTESQCAQIYQIHYQVVRAEIDLVKSMGRGVKPSGPHYRQLEKEKPTKIMDILNDEQRAEFDKLKGKPLQPVTK